MKWRLPWRKLLSPAELVDMESMLNDTLQPVTPSSNFVDELQGRLMRDFANAMDLAAERRTISPAWIIAGAFFASFLVLIAGIRVVIALLGALGILNEMRRQMEEKEEAIPLRVIHH